MYKYMSFELRDKQVDAQKYFYREQNLPQEVAGYRAPLNYEDLLGDMTLNKLHDVFKLVVRKQEDKIDPIRSTYGNIEKDEVDMDQRMLHVENYLKCHKHFSFRELLECQTSKINVIVTFLVMLELMKVGKITIYQEEIFDDIIIESQIFEGEYN